MSVAMVIASLAAVLARLLPGMAEWLGIHWMRVESKMELIKLWMEGVRGWDEMKASHKDLLSVQMSMVIE